MHNSAKNAHDVLPIDVENVLCKIYAHFSRSAKRIEELKAYYEFVQSEYSVSDVVKRREKIGYELTGT